MTTTPFVQWGTALIERFQKRLSELRPRPDASWGVSARYWANPTWSLICLGVVILSAFHPPEGLPIRFCFFYQFFGVDCPGCGMSRGLSNLWRGRFGTAIGYHLFAPAAFLYLVGQSAFLFIGEDRRRRAVEFLNRHDPWFRRVWIWGIVAFAIYGLARSMGQLLLKMHV